MGTVFLQSIRVYGLTLAQALAELGRNPAAAPRSLRRALILLTVFPLFLAVQLTHWLGFVGDEIFFGKYRRIPVKNPVFVSGIPRSGTTFVHRALAADTARFTTFRTWEALLAPSICQRKVLHLLAGIDRAFGGHLRRLVNSLIARAEGDFAEIHATGLDAAEEDYLALLPAAGCFILVLAFPTVREFRRLHDPACWSPKRRTALFTFYHRLIQKHLFCEGRGRQFLSKNAAFSCWTRELAALFPDARFLLCVREPLEALSSQLSSLEAGRAFFGVDPQKTVLPEEFRRLFRHAYPTLLEHARALPRDRFAIIDQAALKKDSPGVILSALKRIGQPVDFAIFSAPPGAPAKPAPHKSRHRHEPADFGFSDESLDEPVIRAYRALVAMAGAAAGNAQDPEPTPDKTPAQAGFPQASEAL